MNSPYLKRLRSEYEGTRTMNFLLDEPEIRSRFAPITPEQYRFMGESGLLGANVELINGFILEKMPKSPLHTTTVARLQAALMLALSQDLFIRKEEPLALTLSEPEPDIAVVYGHADAYAARHPGGEETLLVVEVALSSLALDRKKAEVYAAAGIPCYWLVNLADKTIEVYTAPQQSVYASCVVLGRGDTLTIPFGSDGALPLSAIFPEY